MENYKFTILSLLLFFSVAGFAQEKKSVKNSKDKISSELLKAATSKSAGSEVDFEEEEDDSRYLNGMVPVGNIDRDLPQQKDSLHLPALDNYGRVYSGYSWRYPYLGSFGLWDIHEGLNLQLGVSAFASFGKGGFSGWGQNISAVYAKPINDHLSLAVGGYFNNYSTGIGPFRSAGITAVLNYRFNEHWEAFVYGQKGFWDNRNTVFSHYGPYGYGAYGLGYGPMYDMGMFGDRIGAGVTWHPTPTTTLQVQFEYSTDPHSDFHNRVQDHWEMPSSTPNGSK